MFSMQPGALPFEPNIKSFAISIFVLMGMVHAIRGIYTYVQACWPLLRNRPLIRNPVYWWFKRNRVDEDIEMSSIK
jgi:hypothetical protein